MKPYPNFQAGVFTHQNLEELQNYANVFHDGIAKAFDDLEAEAERIQRDEYDTSQLDTTKTNGFPHTIFSRASRHQES
jgi:hypothetical protein